MIKYNDFSKVCQFYLSDEIDEAYKLGGEERASWVDCLSEKYKSAPEMDINKFMDEFMDAYHADFEKWWKKLPLEEQKRIHFEVKCKNNKILLQWYTSKSFNPETDNLPPTEIEYPNMAFPTKEFRNLAQYVYWVASGYETGGVTLGAWGINKINRFPSTTAKKSFEYISSIK